MTREERINLLNKLLEIEEKNDIGNLTRAERGEFQQWVNDALKQEPMVEIDLYSVIKQKYIEREVLDKIRAEIKQLVSRYTISRERGSMGQVEWEDRLIREVDILQILDKYKAEQE